MDDRNGRCGDQLSWQRSAGPCVRVDMEVSLLDLRVLLLCLLSIDFSWINLPRLQGDLKLWKQSTIGAEVPSMHFCIWVSFLRQISSAAGSWENTSFFLQPTVVSPLCYALTWTFADIIGAGMRFKNSILEHSDLELYHSPIKFWVVLHQTRHQMTVVLVLLSDLAYGKEMKWLMIFQGPGKNQVF